MSDLNLFGKTENSNDEIRIFIYCDEIKVIRNYLGEKWFYLGMLMVEESKKKDVLRLMNQAREESNYYSELHFSKLSNFSYANDYSEKTFLAKKWMELILGDGGTKNFYFNILGINADNLCWQFFGNRKEQKQNAYNRFFRTLLKSSINYFFPQKNVVIVELFHDKEQAMQLHQYFDWHSIYRLTNELENVHFESQFINFIDSDHSKEEIYSEDSHFIQMIDLILGAFRQSFDKSCKKDGCNEIAEIFSPLLQKIIEFPYNKNSRFGYYRKYNFGFFPPHKMNPSDLLNDQKKMSSCIFKNRGLFFIHEGQGELFQ